MEVKQAIEAIKQLDATHLDFVETFTSSQEEARSYIDQSWKKDIADLLKDIPEDRYDELETALLKAYQRFISPVYAPAFDELQSTSYQDFELEVGYKEYYALRRSLKGATTPKRIESCLNKFTEGYYQSGSLIHKYINDNFQPYHPSIYVVRDLIRKRAFTFTIETDEFIKKLYFTLLNATARKKTDLVVSLTTAIGLTYSKLSKVVAMEKKGDFEVLVKFPNDESKIIYSLVPADLTIKVYGYLASLGFNKLTYLTQTVSKVLKISIRHRFGLYSNLATYLGHSGEKHTIVIAQITGTRDHHQIIKKADDEYRERITNLLDRALPSVQDEVAKILSITDGDSHLTINFTNVVKVLSCRAAKATLVTKEVKKIVSQVTGDDDAQATKDN